ncbi:molybdenum cofactor guanylyltransferase MobA [Ramlibacter sp. H39-3-26]|uniref:molybdenum cofactor guanylyltransferase MobA n=1 Tax=Curvibacter soli TaxID=3031331 RepID=UPI0023DA112F|nr:molybdenum cofactor guanylyltransferase MobA [Ramlibacter sp. H39-3-26]MDF1485324.1 molybdenum cofactor guanylyltransferase MobA [Ramlibacter sp. H39-3-26]
MTTSQNAIITGLVLAGGRGTRMGGADKGLEPFHGVPLAQHALRRLAPQVGPLLLNANRNAAAHARFGVPVVADLQGDFAGPLAGMAAGLAHCATPLLATVPCDTPLFPADLVAPLAAALDAAQADIAMAAARDGHGALRSQPVFCLLRATLRESLAAYLRAGGHKVQAWVEQHAHVVVDCGAVTPAFCNANTREELAALERASLDAIKKIAAPA